MNRKTNLTSLGWDIKRSPLSLQGKSGRSSLSVLICSSPCPQGASVNATSNFNMTETIAICAVIMKSPLQTVGTLIESLMKER